jgi:SAM-dependent methyltransferase
MTARFSFRPIHCPTCGPCEQRELGYRGGRYHRYGLGVETRIVRCLGCRLIFPNPFPFPDSAQEIYGDPDKYFVNFDESWKVGHARELIREAGRRLGHPPESLLDVGSGRAEMLRAANLEGVGAIGLEFSQAMIKRARESYDIELYPTPIEKLEGKSRFDTIMLCAVLEHVYDPNAMIEAAARLAKPGAALYLDIPNEPHLLTYVGNAVSRLSGSHAIYNLAPTWEPYHVFGFSPFALRKLLAKHGFEVASLRIWAQPRIPGSGAFKDRIRSFVGTQVNRIANWTGTASNMYVWAVRR